MSIGSLTQRASKQDTYLVATITASTAYLFAVHHSQCRTDAAVFVNPWGLRLEPAAETSCQTAKTVLEICLFSSWRGSGWYG